MDIFFNVWCWKEDSTILTFESEISSSKVDAVNSYFEEETSSAIYLYTIKANPQNGTCERINILHDVLIDSRSDFYDREQILVNCYGIDGVLKGRKEMKHKLYDVDGEVLHVAEITGEFLFPNIKNRLAVKNIKNRLAVKSAVKTGKSLERANLQWFDLSSLNLSLMDFTGADIEGTKFMGSDLRGSTFSHDVPVVEKIHQTVFEAAMNITEQETLDWPDLVVTLAGNEGRILEDRIGAGTAAALIYMASDPSLKKIPHFYNTKVCALFDMKRLAELEKNNAI